MALLHPRVAYVNYLMVALMAEPRVFQSASTEMIDLLRELRKKVVTGFVGGSDLSKIQEQLGVTGNNGL